MMKNSWSPPLPPLLGATALILAASISPSAEATTLTGFQTSGSQMGGMQITVNLFDGSAQTSIWNPTGGSGGGAFGNGWSLTQSGNTFGSFNNPWNFNYSGPSSVASLIIDTIPGNTVFDIVPGLNDPRQTPTSAEGWLFQVVSGTGPSSFNYSVPIDISRGDLFGRLSLFWNAGFRGGLGFLADTDSGTSSDPVRSRDPVPPPPPPPPVPPTLLGLGVTNPVIFEGQGTSATLFGTDNNTEPLNFLLNGNFVGTAPQTSGTRSLTVPLGPFFDEGVFAQTAQVQDPTGRLSNAATQTVTVLNVAPTITQITPNLVVNEGDLFGFSATATDPGIFDVLTYAWDLDQDNLFDDFIGQIGQHSFANQGSYRLGLRVDDGDGGFDFDGFNVTVQNVAPTITQLTDNLVVQRDELFDFFGSAIDPGIDDLLTFDWDLDGDGLFDDFTGVGGQFSFADPGVFNISLRVSDGDGGVAVRSFSVEAVPEPGSTLGLLVLGVLGTSAMWKRQRI